MLFTAGERRSKERRYDTDSGEEDGGEIPNGMTSGGGVWRRRRRARVGGAVEKGVAASSHRFPRGGRDTIVHGSGGETENV